MKRLHIIVEGQTEQEFVKIFLTTFFAQHNILVDAPLIHTSTKGRGGFVNYQHLKNDVIRLLKSEQDCYVSCFVDFFRIPSSVPNFESCLSQSTAAGKIDCLEDAIRNDINDNRFIPYIQMHEFEALLFADNTGFAGYYPVKITSQTQKIIDQYNNPEEINGGDTTAPSKRLLSIIPNYDKVVDGNLIALEVGLDKIMDKCHRFRNWIETLKQFRQ